MLSVAILAVGGFVAFFFYHRVMVTRLEKGMIELEAHLDYCEEAIDTVRFQLAEIEVNQIRRSQVKKTAKKRGRPVDPNSIRQKKMKAGK